MAIKELKGKESGSAPLKEGDASAFAELEEARQARLEALGAAVSAKRKSAINARKQSGIERIWKEDEEYYLGIDDANRSSHAFTKPMGLEGGLQESTPYTSEDEKGQCTAFFNITRQFVDSAAARLGDILLPANDWPFAINPTPIADLGEIRDSVQAVVGPDGQPIAKEDGSHYTLGEFAKEEQADAERKVEKAERRIHDYLTECQFKAEMRKVMEDAAKIGTGVIRGPYPVKQKAKAIIDGAFVMQEKIAPASKRVDPRDLFPDPDCGDNIHNGSYIIERDFLSRRQLRDLIGVPGYLPDAIMKVLKEGPNKAAADDPDAKASDDDRFEVWYYYGEVEREDLIACGCDDLDEEDEPADDESGESESMEMAEHQQADTDGDDSVYAVVVLVNDTVIKGFYNPLSSGEFPYDLMVWQRVHGMPWGIGVARQGRVAQDMLNASARTLMVNTGLSSAPQIVFREGAVIPEDGNMDIYGGKMWLAVEDANTDDIRKAFELYEIPSHQAELINLIQLAQKMMEDATGVTFLLQGQQGSAPDTVGGMELLHKNASALLRRIARIFDENITEPHIRRYYDWILIYGEDDEKGDLEIKAVGSSALVEREIQAMQALQILNMSMNPAFGMSPEKAKDEVLRAWRFEPSKFDMDEEERQKAASAAQNVPPPPAVQSAQIRAQSAERIAQMNMQSKERAIVADMDRDEVYQRTMEERSRMEHETRIEELRLRRELAMMDYANKHEISLEKVKAELAQTAMKLRTTKELVSNKATADELPKPPVEPPGKAPAGESYQR